MAGLSQEAILKCADIALSAYAVDSRWAYFCGVANKRLAKMHELASKIVADI